VLAHDFGSELVYEDTNVLSLPSLGPLHQRSHVLSGGMEFGRYVRRYSPELSSD
jgi:hypothetical protein